MHSHMSDKEVEAAIVRILEIIEETSRLRSAGNRYVTYPDHELNIEHSELRADLAIEFGRRNGWSRAKSQFSIEALAGRKSRGGSRGRESTFLGEHHELFDHFYCYREMQHPFRAAAVVAHLYGALPGTSAAATYPNLVFSQKELDEKAAKARGLGLALTWTQFPSWWSPGSTTLVLYTPLNDRISVPPLRGSRAA